MTTFVDNVIVRSEVIQTGFGFYTDSQLEQLSACQIQSPVSFDSLGHALTGGLLDPRMGATDLGELCRTCNSNSMTCLGHPGHVKLDVSVYHPFLFAQMFNLLKTKCLSCHKFRIHTSKTRQLLIKLKLLEMGYSDEAASVDGISYAAKLDDDDGGAAAEGGGVGGGEGTKKILKKDKNIDATSALS